MRLPGIDQDPKRQRRRKTLQAVIDAGAADEKVLDVLKVQLQQNLFFCIFLVCEWPRSPCEHVQLNA